MIAVALITQLSYGQGNVKQLFSDFQKEKGVTSVSIGKIMMKLASLFTETSGVSSIKVLDFEECGADVKKRLDASVRHIDDPEYELLVSVNEDGGRTKILVKIEKEKIRELVIAVTGEDHTLIRIQGKIDPKNMQQVINDHKNDGR